MKRIDEHVRAWLRARGPRTRDEVDAAEWEAARRRSEREILRSIRRTGWWWPDGS